MDMYQIAWLPALQRDLVLARAVKRKNDPLVGATSKLIKYKDMEVLFASDTPISPASVFIDKDISLAIFTKRLESFLDCGQSGYKPTSEADQWKLKYADKLSRLHSDAKEVVRLLCDRITTMNDKEIIGVMKIKRRGVKSGHASIRIVPKEDSLEAIFRHQTSSGLKAIWKSAFWRLDPQYAKPKTTTARPDKPEELITVVTEPCVLVPLTSYTNEKLTILKKISDKLTESVDLTNLSSLKEVTLPLKAYNLDILGYWSGVSCQSGGNFDRAIYTFRFKLLKLPKGKVPDFLVIKNDVPPLITCGSYSYALFYERLKKIEKWLGVNTVVVNLPKPIPSVTDVIPAGVI
jgi:hypothetical protein